MEIDWNQYELEVIALVHRANAECLRVAPDKKISQISIWTDVQSRCSAVSFETKAHARSFIESKINYFKKLGKKKGQYIEIEVIREIESRGYNCNPADFEMREAATCLHPSLQPLEEVDFSDMERKWVIEAVVEEALLRVVERLRLGRAFCSLVLEKDVWIGISSPRDWYDHVQKLDCPEL